MTTSFDFFIDRGGTFTDLYCLIHSAEGTKERVVKILSEDPANYPDAPREAIRQVLFAELGLACLSDPLSKYTAVCDEYKINSIKMGTTVSTNALLERKGAKTALVTTKGFKDLLEIGYQNRPKIFDLDIQKPKQLYSEVIELDERLFLNDCKTKVLNEYTIEKSLIQLKANGIESLAIALMHSYADARHEQAIKAIATKIGFRYIAISSEVVPMIKYVPRASTTVIDAYLAPVIADYVANFKTGFSDQLKDTELLFMQSDGTLCTAEKFSGYNSILSGPAGGLTALRSIHQDQPLIGFDMGGTSTDVSRFAGDFDLSFDSVIEGLLLQSPQLDITTIAAGGGSRLFYENGMLRVGPESAGSHPGPVCYKKNGYLAITDANLVLGKLDPESFPKVFGPNADEALDLNASSAAFQDLIDQHDLKMSVEELAAGFIKVANETMARPIREVSSAKGFDVKKHALVCFGGAAAQHACAIAKLLGISKVIIHRHSAILSAFGIALAKQSFSKQSSLGCYLNNTKNINQTIDALRADLPEGDFEEQVLVNIRYEGTDTKFFMTYSKSLAEEFKARYQREFGFSLERSIIVDDVLVKQTEILPASLFQNLHIQGFRNEDECSGLSAHKRGSNEYNEVDGDYQTSSIKGPKLLCQDTTTVVIEEGCSASFDKYGSLIVDIAGASSASELERNPVNLAIFSNRFMSIAEQMGKTLERTSISTNIKERRDFSCALFNSKGDLIANAPHQPVHLGSMGYAIKKQLELTKLKPGDVILSNHPVMGGSHLPDLTVISPVFKDSKIKYFVANRAHHADIGGISPGSMPSFSTKLDEEGIAIKAFKLVEANKFQEEELRQLFQESRLLEDNVSDLRAQVAANNIGISLLEDLIDEYSLETVVDFMNFSLENSEQVVRDLFKDMNKDLLEAVDYLDDNSAINLLVTLDKDSGEALFDFTGSAAELNSNLNTPIAVLSSCILYCLRAIIDRDIPLNQGFLRPIKIKVPEASLLNPSEEAAVVAGNVQTSQRIVDVIFKAFNTCSASQGCMNNVIFGNQDFGYYETIGGGAGAGNGYHGASGVHTHMTNTRITDPEILESRYPVILREFSIRYGSGGYADFKGGNGLIRTFEFLTELELSLLTERRTKSPYALNGAKPGAKGKNLLNNEELASKVNTMIKAGDIFSIHTPGGGGYASIND